MALSCLREEAKVGNVPDLEPSCLMSRECQISVQTEFFLRAGRNVLLWHPVGQT